MIVRLGSICYIIDMGYMYVCMYCVYVLCVCIFCSFEHKKISIAWRYGGGGNNIIMVL